MNSFEIALPKTVDEAVRASGTSRFSGRALAGGTDLVAILKEGLENPKRLVNLKQIPELKAIRSSKDSLEIGALATLTEVAANPEVRQEWPALAATIEKTATPNVRNVGTIGGNLGQRVRCWYFRHNEYPCLKKGGAICYAQQGENEYHAVFDNRICCAPHPSNVAPVAIAYDGEVEIAGPDGKRTIPVEELFVTPDIDVTRELALEPGEIVTQLILPRKAGNRRSAYVEVREKQSFDWALVGATAVIEITEGRISDARVVLNAVAPTPQRRRDLESRLVGEELTDDLIASVSKRAVRGGRALRDNEYKLQLVKTCVSRALRATREG